MMHITCTMSGRPAMPFLTCVPLIILSSVLCSCTGVTGQNLMMSALMCYFCFMHRNNIMHVCSDAISHFNVFSQGFQ